MYEEKKKFNYLNCSHEHEYKIYYMSGNCMKCEF